MTPLLVAICLLIHCCTVHSQSTFIENDSIVFPEDPNDTPPSDITERLKDCIRDNFKIEFNGECRVLLTTEGSCPEGEWLVLDVLYASLPQMKIQGKCAQRRCAPLQHYWVEQRRCVYPNESSSLCPKGNILSTDYFGDGFCECIRDPIYARERSGRCYQVFTRGPCPEGKVWVQDTGRMECRADNCITARRRFPAKTIVSWQDGMCYAVGDQGPCAQGKIIHINMWSLRPECGEPFTPLNLVNPPCTGFDHKGNCVRSVITPQTIFYSKVKDQVSNKRNRKSFRNPK